MQMCEYGYYRLIWKSGDGYKASDVVDDNEDGDVGIVETHALRDEKKPEDLCNLYSLTDKKRRRSESA